MVPSGSRTRTPRLSPARSISLARLVYPTCTPTYRSPECRTQSPSRSVTTESSSLHGARPTGRPAKPSQARGPPDKFKQPFEFRRAPGGRAATGSAVTVDEGLAIIACRRRKLPRRGGQSRQLLGDGGNSGFSLSGGTQAERNKKGPAAAVSSASGPGRSRPTTRRPDGNRPAVASTTVHFSDYSSSGFSTSSAGSSGFGEIRCGMAGFSL